MSAREFTAERGTRRLHGTVEGPHDGPLVVLVPGLGQGAKLFGTLPRRFARQGHRCVTYDPVGIAPSSPHPDDRDWTFDDAADDLITVAEAADAETADETRPVRLVGTSLGGKVALATAARHGERVARVVALASSLVPSARAERIFRFFAAVATHVPDEAFGDVVAPFLIGRTFTEARPRVVDDMARAMRPDPASRALMLAQAAAARALDGAAITGAIRVPCLCLAGLEDTLTDADDVAATAAAIADARFARIERAGHSLLLESAGVLERVLAFLDE